MTQADLGPAALLAVALETFRAEILPSLPPERRYAGAMTANALEIAARGVGREAGGGERRLLDAVYGAGEGSMQALANDIRSGRVDGRSHTDLGRLLRDHLAGELAVRNPRFLAGRQA